MKSSGRELVNPRRIWYANMATITVFSNTDGFESGNNIITDHFSMNCHHSNIHSAVGLAVIWLMVY